MELNTLIIVMQAAIFAVLIPIALWMFRSRTKARKVSGHRVGRVVLPMSTGMKVPFGESALITARPQSQGIRPDRLFISGVGTPGGAGDWVVNDIRIAGKSQFLQSGDVPGDMFATDATDSLLAFDSADRGLDVVIIVSYVGSNKDGCEFYASIVGEAIGPELPHYPKDAKAAPPAPPALRSVV